MRPLSAFTAKNNKGSVCDGLLWLTVAGCYPRVMDTTPEDYLQRELAPGERLLWSGVPRQGLRLRAADALLIPFSLMWGGFAIFWEYMVLHVPATSKRPESAAPEFMTVWGIPFVLIGLYMIVGRFFVDAWWRSRTVLGVTNERVFIVSSAVSKQVKSLPLQTLGELALQESRDGSGTIVFGPAVPYSGVMVPGWLGASRRAAPSFDGIQRVRDVYELIRKAQTRSREA